MFVAFLFSGPLLADTVRIKTQELPWAIKGVGYRELLSTDTSGHCPAADVSLTLVSGTLPPGIQLFGFGLEGAPQETGRYHFVIRAANNCGADMKSLELVVIGRPILIATPLNVTLRFRPDDPELPEDTLRVESGWPNLPYMVEVIDAPWLRAESLNGVTPGPGSALTADPVRLQADPANLTPGIYRGTLKFTSFNAANSAKVNVTLQVLSRKAEIGKITTPGDRRWQSE